MTPEARWRVGVVGTVIEILMFVIMIIIVSHLLNRIEEIERSQTEVAKQISVLVPLLQDSSVSSDSNLAIRRMTLTLNTIERFLRTTPLVECGNWNDRREKERTIQGSH